MGFVWLPCVMTELSGETEAALLCVRRAAIPELKAAAAWGSAPELEDDAGAPCGCLGEVFLGFTFRKLRRPVCLGVCGATAASRVSSRCGMAFEC